MGGGLEAPLDAMGLLAWARRKAASSPDALGWSARLVLFLHSHPAAGLRTVEDLAWHWSRPPDQMLPMVAELTSRYLAGVLIDRRTPAEPNKPPRPIVAPPCARRAAAAVCGRRSLPFTRHFAESRSQFGLSAGPVVRAYPLAARAAVLAGCTLVTRDKKNSFNNLRREAIVGGVTEALASPSRALHPLPAAHLVDAVYRFFGDVPGVPRAFASFATNRVTCDALAQG